MQLGGPKERASASEPTRQPSASSAMFVDVEIPGGPVCANAYGVKPLIGVTTSELRPASSRRELIPSVRMGSRAWLLRWPTCLPSSGGVGLSSAQVTRAQLLVSARHPTLIHLRGTSAGPEHSPRRRSSVLAQGACAPAEGSTEGFCARSPRPVQASVKSSGGALPRRRRLTPSRSVRSARLRSDRY